jgi:hypothetical protein
LYVFGGLYSLLIFHLCYKLKTKTSVKLIVLIGGILTYGGLAILTYFFDVRKKFNQENLQENKKKLSMVKLAIIFAIASFTLLIILMLLVYLKIYP